MEGSQFTNSIEDEHQSAREYFDYLFAYAIIYGMSKEDYWYHSDYTLFWAYEHAYKEKIRMQRDYDNQLAWVSGLYIQSAVASVLAGEEYREPLDFREMERWNSLSEEEKRAELQREAVENSKAEVARVKALLEQQKQQKNGGA